MEDQIQYPIKASKGLLIAGWIFAILGGLIGLVIGIVIWTGKVKDQDGNKIPKYDEGSRKQGMIMFFIALAWMILSAVIRAA